MSFEMANPGLLLWNAVPDASPSQEGPKCDAVVSLVGGQSGGSGARASVASRHPDRVQGGNGRLEVVNIARVQMQSDGQAIAIDHYMALTGYARSGGAGFVAPFFAFT